MNVHLVFDSDHIEVLKDELEQINYSVKETDTSLDTFAQWAQSNGQNHSEVAFVYGGVNVSKYDSAYSHRQAVFERIRQVRISRPELRLVLLFPAEVQQDEQFLQKLIQLGIYDLYFDDEPNLNDIDESLKRTRTLADVEHLITGYKGTSNDGITETSQYNQYFPEEETQEIESDSKFKVKKAKEEGKKKLLFQKGDSGSKPIKLPSFKLKNPLENVNIKAPSFSFNLNVGKNTTNHLIQSKVIVVGSLHGGAGSTFLIHNFMEYITEQGLQTGVLEATDQSPVWLQIIGREIGHIPNSFKSWVSQVKQENCINSDVKIQTENNIVIPLSSKDSLEGIDNDIYRTVIFNAKQIPLLFVDISTDWESEFAKEAIKVCDEFWVVVNPDPNHLNSQRHKKKTVMNLAYQLVGEDNCKFIGNKWGKGIDNDEFPVLPEIRLPYFEKGIKANMQGTPLYSLNPRLFNKDFKILGKRVVQPIKTKQSFFEVKGG
ncbi:hypothetical protein [Cytobacillus sp. IB215665]|uniref:hypothetical protein n=1 Tax=Cytobacillus sp. IB215665 TaxID=3097357 RepID=UPI002A145894|nr:hypothetical protein [Cytobacillus sp. IB215665]MDX8367187.1 hypothetical protein [Cytobacillus sp. IB215665]